MLKHVFYLVFCALTHTRAPSLSMDLFHPLFSPAMTACGGLRLKWVRYLKFRLYLSPHCSAVVVWLLRVGAGKSWTVNGANTIQGATTCSNKARFGWVETDRSPSQDGRSTTQTQMIHVRFQLRHKKHSPRHRRPNRSAEPWSEKRS